MTLSDRITYLRQVPLFAHLSEANLYRVAEIAREVNFPRRSQLAHLGQPGRSFIYLISGEALVRAVQNGHFRPVAYLRGGSFFGTTSLLLGEPHDAHVVAMTDVVAMVIDRAAFRQLLQSVPAIEEQLTLPGEIASKLRNQQFPWLGPHEVVATVGRRHWALLLRALILPTLGAVLGAAVLTGLGSLLDAWSWTPSVIIALAFYIPIGFFIGFDWHNDYIAVTTERVVHREFILAEFDETQHTAPLNVIQNVAVESGFFGKLLGFGTLTIETAAQSQIGRIEFTYAAHAEAIKDVIFQQMQRAQARVVSSASEEMRRELKQRLGWITAEELMAQGQARIQPPPEERPVQVRSSLVEALKRLRPFPPLRLVEGQQITWRKHWVFLLRRIFWPLLAGLAWLAVVIGLISGRVTTPPDLTVGLALGLLVVLVAIVVWFAWGYIDWGNDVYILTDERIIDVEQKPFFFAEHRRTAPLDRIQNVNMNIPGPIAALLHYGDVDIDTAGDEGRFTFTNVVEPAEVAREIMARVARQREQRQRLEAQQRRREIIDWVATYEALRKERNNK